MSDYNEVKDNLTGILMSAVQSVCPTDVDDISDALSLIQKQRERISELKIKNQQLEVDLDNEIQENNELAATLEKLGFIADYEYNDEDERIADMHGVLEATPRQNLNAVKREVARESFIKGCKFGAECYSFEWERESEQYATEHYPDKE